MRATDNSWHAEFLSNSYYYIFEVVLFQAAIAYRLTSIVMHMKGEMSLSQLGRPVLPVSSLHIRNYIHTWYFSSMFPIFPFLRAAFGGALNFELFRRLVVAAGDGGGGGGDGGGPSFPAFFFPL